MSQRSSILNKIKRAITKENSDIHIYTGESRVGTTEYIDQFTSNDFPDQDCCCMVGVDKYQRMFVVVKYYTHAVDGKVDVKHVNGKPHVFCFFQRYTGNQDYFTIGGNGQFYNMFVSGVSLRDEKYDDGSFVDTTLLPIVNAALDNNVDFTSTYNTLFNFNEEHSITISLIKPKHLQYSAVTNQTSL